MPANLETEYWMRKDPHRNQQPIEINIHIRSSKINKKLLSLPLEIDTICHYHAVICHVKNSMYFRCP